MPSPPSLAPARDDDSALLLLSTLPTARIPRFLTAIYNTTYFDELTFQDSVSMSNVLQLDDETVIMSPLATDVS